MLVGGSVLTLATGYSLDHYVKDIILVLSIGVVVRLLTFIALVFKDRGKQR